MEEEKLGKEGKDKEGFGEFKDVESDAWHFFSSDDHEADGEILEGILVNKLESEGEVSARYYIDTNSDDGVRLVWGTAVLDQRMSLVKVGDKVRITYKGKEKTKKGRDVHIFKVEVAKRQ